MKTRGASELELRARSEERQRQWSYEYEQFAGSEGRQGENVVAHRDKSLWMKKQNRSINDERRFYYGQREKLSRKHSFMFRLLLAVVYRIRFSALVLPKAGTDRKLISWKVLCHRSPSE
jgi:hypothetical protein